MFKRNKDFEKINLLETDLGTAVKNKVKDDSAGNLIFLGAVGLAVLIAGGIYLTRFVKNKGIEKDIKSTKAFNESSETAKKLELQTKLIGIRDQVNQYYDKMNNSYDAFLSQPVINGEKFLIAQDIASKTAEKYDTEVSVKHSGFSEGSMSLDITSYAENDEESEEKKMKMVQEFPSELIMQLLSVKDSKNQSVFGSATYPGYEVKEVEVKEDEDPEEKRDQVTLSVDVKFNGRKSAYHPEETEEATESETQAAE